MLPLMCMHQMTPRCSKSTPFAPSTKETWTPPAEIGWPVATQSLRYMLAGVAGILSNVPSVSGVGGKPVRILVIQGTLGRAKWRY